MSKESATREGVLNNRQIKFIEEYLVDFNATQAAIRAGYSQRTAGSQGFDLLKKPEIQQAIKAKQKEAAHKSGITRDRIIAEVARIAFSDVRRLFDERGALKRLQDIDDDAAGAIAGIDVVEMNSDDGSAPMFVKKIKLWDKNAALEKLLKHLGMDNGEQPTQAPTGVTVALDFDAVRKKREAT